MLEPENENDPLHPSRALHAGERPFPFIPACDHYAGSEKTMIRSLDLQAQRGPVFDVTLDLEDGAPAGREAEHVALVVDLLNSERNVHRHAGVRVHDYRSPHWRADVDAIVQGAGTIVSYITIPKVEGARQLAEMITYIQNACAFSKVAREVIPIHVLIETHAAVFDAFKIAGLPWLRGLDFGIMDFVSSHHGALDGSAMRSPGQFDHELLRRAKTIQVAAALGNGLVPAHGVTLDVRDVDQVRADALRARRDFGYLRMWSIHPAQIDPILEAFAPDHSEVALASEVLLAARTASWGPISLADRLYDRASYRYYWAVLRRAHVADVPLDDIVRETFFADGA